MNNTVIRTEKLCKTFSHEGVQQHVLKNLDLEIDASDHTVIMGPSGAGKSTLLYALSGMDRPTLGSIHFAGQDISRLSPAKLSTFRRSHCGFVFQQIHLLDSMSVMDNVMAIGLLSKQNRRTLAGRARDLLDQVGLSTDDARKFPSMLSGGEAQRAAVVRALINQPAVVFADEPTGQLNSEASHRVLDLLTAVHESGQTVVAVTHDLRTALRGSRILYLRDGVVQGELTLGRYRGEDPVRHERLADFLAGMGW